MNINKKIDIFDFTEKMQSIVNFLDGAMPKITCFYDMPLYKLVPISKNIEQEEFELYNINVEDELEKYQGNDEGAYNLICLNYKEGMPLLYYTNSIFFDNTNKTLPLGMNLSSKVLIDNKKLEFVLVNKTKFRTNSYFNDKETHIEPKSKDIFVYEYDVFLKEESLNKARNELISNIESMTPNVALQIENQEEKINLEESESVSVETNIVQELFEKKLKSQLEDIDTGDSISVENSFGENQIMESEVAQETEEIQEEDISNQSRKILKIQAKFEKEMEKQKRRQEKAKEKLEKKGKNNIF